MQLLTCAVGVSVEAEFTAITAGATVVIQTQTLPGVDVTNSRRCMIRVTLAH